MMYVQLNLYSVVRGKHTIQRFNLKVSFSQLLKLQALLSELTKIKYPFIMANINCQIDMT